MQPFDLSSPRKLMILIIGSKFLKVVFAAYLSIHDLEDNWDIDQQKITSLIHSSELREILIARATGLVDLNGASRIVDAITNL